MSDDAEKPGNVVDLSHALNVKKMLEGELFVYCPLCESELDGFGVKGAFDKAGKFMISELICLSAECRGQSFIPVFKGEVK